MAGLTLAQADAQLAAWVAASTAVAGGQSYTIGSRSLSRADASDIKDMVVFWNDQVKSLTSGRSGMRLRGITPA